MRINSAHLREKAAAGGWIDFAIFDARSNSGTDADNASTLVKLSAKARAAGLKIDQAALAFEEQGHIRYYGARPLVEYLRHRRLPIWTHYVDL